MDGKNSTGHFRVHQMDMTAQLYVHPTPAVKHMIPKVTELPGKIDTSLSRYCNRRETTELQEIPPADLTSWTFTEPTKTAASMFFLRAHRLITKAGHVLSIKQSKLLLKISKSYNA